MSDHQTIKTWAEPEIARDFHFMFVYFYVPLLCHTVIQNAVSTVKLHLVAFLDISQTRDYLSICH
jgi:hypothetical protein